MGFRLRSKGGGDRFGVTYNLVTLGRGCVLGTLVSDPSDEDEGVFHG